MASTYIKAGSSLRVYDSSIESFDRLPAATYVVEFSPLSGFSLRQVEDLTVGEERVYGSRQSKVDKVMRAWQASSRSLGVMLSGDKGQGKSLFLRMLARDALASGLPVVRVTESFEGIASFIDSLGEALIVFDEFEKIFPSGGRRSENGTDEQAQFLGLFDGTSSTRRMYCVTVNDLLSVSSYLVNRPGRFHYHLRFAYPTPEEVDLYLREQVSQDDPRIADAVRFSSQVPLNYDHLRAVAFEMRADAEASFAELVGDLNIKAVEPPTYIAIAKFTDAPDIVGNVSFNPLSDGPYAVDLYLRSGHASLYGSFHTADLVARGQSLVLDGARLTMDEDDEDTDEIRPIEVVFNLVGQADYSYRRL